jgi:hypothetical protein
MRVCREAKEGWEMMIRLMKENTAASFIQDKEV